MHAKAILIWAMIAYVEARFGQEQATQAKIAAVKGGAPGAAATIAGASISDLLGAANSCQKLITADKIVSDLGGGADAIAAARAHVAAEKNTNPFANNNAQKVCADPTLPKTQELRGITPLIDPAVDTTGAVNALSAQTVKQPLDATGKSVFDLLKDKGLDKFVVAEQAAGGAAAAAPAAAGNAGGQKAGQANAGQAKNKQATAGQNAKNGQAQNGQAAAEEPTKNATEGNAANAGNAAQGKKNKNKGANNKNKEQKAANNAGNNNAAKGAAAGAATGAAAGGAAAGGANFGKCTPTIIFEAGQPGRKANEFTFQIADKTARGGQQDALNPAIITNALCNQLINVCGANQAAVTKCRDAEKQALASGKRDKSTADTFNTAIGFPGAVTNPDGGPADKPAAARKMRRGLRFTA